MAFNHTHKVAMLLAKATHPNTPRAEAESALNLATSLMAQHNITESMIRQTARDLEPETPCLRTVTIPSPWATQKSSILHRIMEHVGVKGYNTSDYNISEKTGRAERTKVVKMFGFPSDLDFCETLFAALCIHATREMLHTKPAGTHGKRWAPGFLYGYASEIGRRFKQQRDEQISQHDRDHNLNPGTTQLALRDRKETVNDMWRQHLESEGLTLRTVSARNVSIDGLAGGARAGKRADIGQTKLSGGRLALNA